MRSLFLIIFPALLLSCCGQPSLPVHLPKFLVSGLYVISDHSHFCGTWDTVSVTRDRTQHDVYLIIRQTTFQRHLNDLIFPAEKTSCIWYGAYNEESLTMGHNGSGRDLTFLPAQSALRLDGMVYQKIE